MTAEITPKAHNFSNDPIYFEFETALISGAEPPYTPDEDNLWCEINVETYKLGDALDQKMKFRIPFSRYNKRARFDLSGLIQIPATAPPDALLNTTPGIISQGLLDHVRRVQVTAADAYGIPLEPDTPIELDEFNVVKGGTKYFQGFGEGPTEALLVNNIDQFGQVIVKQVRRDQPDLISFYVHESKSVFVFIQFYFKDGTISGEWSLAEITASPNAVNIIQSGYLQLDVAAKMDELNITEDEVEFYKIRVTDLSLAPGAVDYCIYQLDDRPLDRDTYIAFFNGIGGVEITRFSGKHRKAISARSDLAMKVTGINTDWANDPIVKTNANAHESYILNSGFISKGQADVLGQMMLGDAWIADNVRKKFYKIYIEGVNMPVWDDEDELNSVEITYRTHDYKDYNRFNF